MDGIEISRCPGKILHFFFGKRTPQSSLVPLMPSPGRCLSGKTGKEDPRFEDPGHTGPVPGLHLQALDFRPGLYDFRFPGSLRCFLAPAGKADPSYIAVVVPASLINGKLVYIIHHSILTHRFYLFIPFWSTCNFHKVNISFFKQAAAARSHQDFLHSIGRSMIPAA